MVYVNENIECPQGISEMVECSAVREIVYNQGHDITLIHLLTELVYKDFYSLLETNRPTFVSHVFRPDE